MTPDEKKERAEEAGKLFGHNKYWHSHGRMIGINTLKSLLRLKIEDYSAAKNLQPLIRPYNDLITEYIGRLNYKAFMHSRKYFLGGDDDH